MRLKDFMMDFFTNKIEILTQCSNAISHPYKKFLKYNSLPTSITGGMSNVKDRIGWRDKIWYRMTFSEIIKVLVLGKKSREKACEISL